MFQNAGSLLCARQEIANCNKYFCLWLHFPYYQMQLQPQYRNRRGLGIQLVMEYLQRMQWTSVQGSVPIQAVRALRWQKKISICEQPGRTSSLQAVICNIPSRRFYLKLILSKRTKCLQRRLSLPVYLGDSSDHRDNRHLRRKSVWFRAHWSFKCSPRNAIVHESFIQNTDLLLLQYLLLISIPVKCLYLPNT